MPNGRFFQNIFVRAGLELFAWQAALVALFWLLYQRVSGLQRISFGDALFLAGLLEVTIANAGMMAYPLHGSRGPWQGPPVMPDLPVPMTGGERRARALREWLEKRPFTIRLFASGLLTMLLAVGVTFFN